MPETAQPVDIQAGKHGERADSPKERVKNAKASRQKPTLPRPKALRVQIPQLEKWVRSFSAEQQGRAVIHGYRDWPVTNRKLIGDSKERLIFQWDGVFPFEPCETIPDMQSFILHNQDWGGSGKYKIMVTEIGVPGCLSMAIFSMDDADFPPKVDPATLVVGHPDNKGYLEGLRAAGIAIPGDDPEKYRQDQEQKKSMDIATAAFEHVTKQNERLQDKMEKLSERVEEDTGEVDISETAAETVLGSALRMVEKQVDRVTQQSAVSYNPIEVAKSVLEMTKEMKGDSNGVIAVVQAMAAQQATFLTTMLEQQREETKYWREKATAVAVTATEQKSVMDQLKDVAEFKSLARDLFGREPRAEREPEPPKKGVLETILENPNLPQMFNSVMAGLVQLATLARAPLPGFVAAGQPNPEALRGALAQPNAAEQNPAEAVDAERQKAVAATLAFMQKIEKTFIVHFYDLEKEDLNGYTFAHCMQCEFVPNGQLTALGRQEYEMIRDRWGAQFDAIIRQYPPIWNIVQGNIAKYTQFLKEFMEYDRFIAQQSEEPPQPGRVTAIKAN